MRSKRYKRNTAKITLFVDDQLLRRCWGAWREKTKHVYVNSGIIQKCFAHFLEFKWKTLVDIFQGREDEINGVFIDEPSSGLGLKNALLVVVVFRYIIKWPQTVSSMYGQKAIYHLTTFIRAKRKTSQTLEVIKRESCDEWPNLVWRSSRLQRVF